MVKNCSRRLLPGENVMLASHLQRWRCGTVNTQHSTDKRVSFFTSPLTIRDAFVDVSNELK
eukprot:scaffold2067_cov101-Cylindrotheca_fusiformis.AAC.3